MSVAEQSAHLFNTVDDALAEYAAGHFVVVVDDVGRENEGDLIMAAEKMTEEKMAFMVRHTSGVICVPMTARRCEELGLRLMVPESEMTDPHKTKYTISVDYKHGTSTGISAMDRAATAVALASSKESKEAFSRPGHMFPLRAEEGGVLKRFGHTEAGVEIVLDNGKMARRDDLVDFCQKHHLKMITIEDIQTHIRRKMEKEKITTW